MSVSKKKVNPPHLHVVHSHTSGFSVYYEQDNPDAWIKTNVVIQAEL